MKTCNTCGETKPLTSFHKKAASPDGLQRTCKTCVKKANAVWYAKNSDRVKANVAEWQRRNPAARKAHGAAWRAAHAESKKAYDDGWRHRNPEKVYARVKNWTMQNPGKVNARNAKRRAAQLRAIPPWADIGKIRVIYEMAAEMRASGFDVHVDHVVPLQGEMVCGLHVQTNLRIIHASANVAKGNSFDARMLGA